MPCAECGYRLRAGQAECPRCRHRPHGERPGAASSGEVRMPRLAVACLIAGVLLLTHFGLRAHHRAQAAAAQEARAGDVFARAHGPCRDGAETPCRGGIAALHAMRDSADAALLLGDLRVALYLHDQPHGVALQGRWRRDEFSAEELTALGDQAHRRNLIVFRSFWMYANVKKNHFPVPLLTINEGS